MNDEVRRALREDKLIDIITTGAKTGIPRKTEIWFTNIDGRIIICGTPDAIGMDAPRKRRDWLANLKANPAFLFCLKESITMQLSAKAELIVDREDRKQIMNAPETKWYREQGESVEELIVGSPIVEVFFAKGVV